MTDTQAITVRLSRDRYEQLRKEAFETRRSMNEIIADSIGERLDGITAEQYGQLCGLFEAAWHHTVPDSLDDLASVTSPDARKLAMLATEAMKR